METFGEPSGQGRDERGVAILDGLENSLAAICARTTRVSADDAAFLAALAAGVEPDMVFSGDEPDLCGRLTDIYAPFWGQLRVIERHAPGTVAKLLPFPSPDAVWRLEGQRGGSGYRFAHYFNANNVPVCDVAAGIETDAAIQALTREVILSRMSASAAPREGLAPAAAQVVGPVARAFAQRHTPCRPAGGRTYLIAVRDAPTQSGDREAALIDSIGNRARLLFTAQGHKVYVPSPNDLVPHDLFPSGNDTIVGILTAALDAVVGGNPEAFGLDHVTLFQLPPRMAFPLAAGHTHPGYYAALLDECDLFALAQTVNPSGQWQRAREALYPPRTLAQRAAAAVASRPITSAWNPFVLDVLPTEVAHLAAVYRGAHDCASGLPDPDDIEGLDEAARHLGIDPNSPVYVGRPRTLCGDVRAAIAGEYGNAVSSQVAAPVTPL